MFNASERHKRTHEAFLDPQIGDRFEEMYTFWLFVVYRGNDTIATLEGSAPVTFPKEGKLRVYRSLEEFRERFSYDYFQGYWVNLVDRGNDVTGWYEAAYGQLPAYPGQDSAMAECLNDPH